MATHTPDGPAANGQAGDGPALDGPTLRAIRESMRIPLRRIARRAGMSHGHLSKVERGEYGRPVTPVILLAYEKVTGVSLADAAAAIAQPGGGVTGSHGRSWRPGELGNLRRLQFNATVGALNLGGQLGEPLPRVLDSAGQAGVPAVSRAEVAVQLQQQADLLVALDLRHGSAVTEQLTRHVLRWTATMVQSIAWEQEDLPVYRVLATIGHRAAWAAFDQNHHESARTLHRTALFCAVRAQDHDLRGHIVADIAAQHNHVGYHHNAVDLLRIVEADERMSPVVHMLIRAVRARAHAAVGDAAECRRQIDLAEHAYRQADPAQPGWVGRTAAAAGLLPAAAGHALAVLATATNNPNDHTDAVKHLTQAIDSLDPTSHTRSRALCQARLALLHINADELDHATQHGIEAVRAAAHVHSTRLVSALQQLRTAAADHPDTNSTQDLVAAIDTICGDSPQATDEATT